MKSRFAIAVLFFASCFSGSLSAITDDIVGSQNEDEKSVQSVVRNKRYHKSDKLELGISGGVMPYDSVLNHYSVGGRLLWHFSDHIAWEVLDAQLLFSSFTGYPFNAIASGGPGIADMQAAQLNQVFATGIQVSPIYGKIRFFGSQVLYFDMYGSIALGVANTSIHKFSGVPGAITDSVVQTGINPMGVFAIGFKLFFGRAMSLNVDLRDYIIASPMYGGTRIRDNYTVFLGLSFFLPTFG